MSKRRMNNNKKLLLIIVGIIIIAGLIYGFRMLRDVFGSSRNAEEISIIVPQGWGLAQISEALANEGIISHPRVFRLYAGRQNGVVFQQGNHFVNRNMSYSQLITALSTIPPFRLPEGTEQVTIPEGFELREIADRLYNRGLIDRERFIYEIENGDFDFDFVRAIPTASRIYRLEGYLFPATYDILPNYTEWDIINVMLQTFERIVLPVYNEINPTQSLDEIIIMASMVEREAVHDGERATIAGVFYNRIARGMLLQSCATVKYTFDLGTRPAVLTNAQTRIDTPYNTYMHPGLPIGPIGSPGLASIHAAMEWEHHDYLYFTANVDWNGHVFSRTLAEHNAASRERERANRQ